MSSDYLWPVDDNHCVPTLLGRDTQIPSIKSES